MAVPSLVELAEAGAHFGHHRSLTYPRSRDFVYMVKSNVALIDLEKTQEALKKAQEVFHQYLAENKPVLFVGTRRAVRGITREIAEAVNCPYITERWFGGMLTNFSTIQENIKRLNEQEEFLSGEKSQKLTKKERLMTENKLARSRRFLGGVSKLKEMPALIILASASEDKIAVEEANQLGIPVISITDTDMNPELITYPIPANDDAPKAVELILRTVVSKLEPSDKPKKVSRTITAAPTKKTAKTAPAKTKDEGEATEKAPKARKAAVKKTAAIKKAVTKKPTAKKVAKKAVAKAK